jgi:hypothetical protein
MEHRIYKAPFCRGPNHYWLIEINDGGIGTPLYDVDVDIQYFVGRERERIRDIIKKEKYASKKKLLAKI